MGVISQRHTSKAAMHRSGSKAAIHAFITCCLFGDAIGLGAAKLGPQLQGSLSYKLGEWILMTVGVLGLHLVVLMLGWAFSGSLGLSREKRIAVAIAGSQKTLMVGLLLAIDLGVSILPMVTFHLGQLFVDTLIADRWARQGASVEK